MNDELERSGAEKKIAHLGFIESTIERMANTSSAIKGMSFGLVAALLGFGVLSGSDELWIAIFLLAVSILLVIVLWFYDGFYLHQERLFRKLYDDVRNKTEEQIDFSMMNHLPMEKEKRSHFFSACRSRSVWPFYSIQLTIIVVYFVLTIILIISNNGGGTSSGS